jgi:hypothetical protein
LAKAKELFAARQQKEASETVTIPTGVISDNSVLDLEQDRIMEVTGHVRVLPDRF